MLRKRVAVEPMLKNRSQRGSINVGNKVQTAPGSEPNNLLFLWLLLYVPFSKASRLMSILFSCKSIEAELVFPIG